MRFSTRLFALALTLNASPAPTALADDLTKAFAETIYVPAYSRIFSFPDRSELLAATLTVHNVDPQTPLTVTKVDYHGEDGKLLKSILDAPLRLEPLGSASFLVPSNDTTGGVGANFLVEWSADQGALSPLTEAVMVTGPGTPGPSFTSRGRVISRTAAEE
jgi:hypothetical protein